MEGPVTWTEVVLTLVAALVTLVAIVIGGISLYLAHVYRKYAHIPQPPRESFFLGHTLIKRRERRGGIFFGEIVRQYVKELGPTFVLITMGRAQVLTVDQEAIKEMLVVGNFPKSKIRTRKFGYIYGQRFVGRGLLTDPITERWSRRRASVNPAFHRQQLRSLMAVFNQVGNDLMDKLADSADGHTVVTMMETLSRTTLDVIGKVAFSIDINSLNQSSSPFLDAIHKALMGYSRETKSFITHLIPFIDAEFKKDVRDAINLLRDTGRKILEQRELDEARGNPVPTDVISFALSAKKNDPSLTLEEILDDFVTFFLAGQETTANTLGFVFRELGRYPHMLKRVQEEVDSAVGKRHDIEFEDIGKLEYTSMVIKESLRLFPPVDMAFRDMPRDYKISGYLIPKGTSVGISPYASARNEEFVPDATTFDPDRFQPESPRKPPTYAYFPFLLGPRNCIGMSFAQIEMKVILAKFFQRFTYKLDPTQPFEIDENASLRPKGGTRVIISHQDN